METYNLLYYNVYWFLAGENAIPLQPHGCEAAVEMGLKGVGKLESVQDKSLKDGAAEIGNSMLSLDSIESMEHPFVREREDSQELYNNFP